MISLMKILAEGNPAQTPSKPGTSPTTIPREKPKSPGKRRPLTPPKEAPKTNPKATLGEGEQQIVNKISQRFKNKRK